MTRTSKAWAPRPAVLYYCTMSGWHGQQSTRRTASARRALTDRSLWLIIIAFWALATAWNFIVPPYENLDELEHAEVVRHIVITGKLPIHGAAEAAGYRVRQEASQPPLYHILAALWSRALGLPTDPHAPEPTPPTVVACGLTGTLYNKATWIHNPAEEAFPWHGTILTLHVLRIFSMLLQTFTLLGTWALVRRVFPAGPTAWLATSLVAFNPQFLLMTADVNNDNAVVPLATWGLVLAYDLWHHGHQGWRAWVLGLVSGLAALSKLSGLGVVGLGLLALIVRWAQRRESFTRTVLHSAAIMLPAALLLVPWIWRNLQLYSDPTALAPMLEKVGYRTSSPGWGDFWMTWASFWGQLPCTFYPRVFYLPYGILTLGGLIGLALQWRRLSPSARALSILSTIWYLVITGAWWRWNAITPAPGGRLLFPAIAAGAFILATGWRGAGKRASMIWSILLPIWAVLTLRIGPVEAFAYPRILPAARFREGISIAQAGDAIKLLRYTARIIPHDLGCAFVSQAYCQPTLDLTLTWQAERSIEQDLTMVLQLVSLAPGDTSLRLNYNHWPGRGNLPTRLWPVGQPLRDHYRIPLPQSPYETQAWRLTVAWVDPVDNSRLPTYNAAGEPTGNVIDLGLYRVPDTNPPEPDWHHPATPVDFRLSGASPWGLRLSDARVTPGFQGDPWQVTLVWESLAPIDSDLTVFVHAYDSSGTLLTGGDGPPRTGTFPTHLWLPGDRIIDTHTLAITEDMDVEAIAVGLYDAVTGARAEAMKRGQTLPDNAVILWRAKP